MSYLVRICLATLFCCALCSCKEDPPAVESVNELALENLRKLQLVNYNTYCMEPLLNKMEASIAQLEQEIGALMEHPNQHNIESLRDTWLESAKLMRKYTITHAHKEVSSYVFGLDINRIKEQLEGVGLISDNIFIKRRLAAMSTIEYLIFDEDNYDAWALLQGNGRRKELLAAAGKAMTILMQTYRLSWETEKEAFTAAIENKYNSSHTRIANIFYFYPQRKWLLLMMLMGDPSVATSPNIYLLEAHWSETSRELFVSEFEQLKRVFYGDFKKCPDEYGYDDYLLEFDQGQVLLKKIDVAFQAVDTALDGLGIMEEDFHSHPERIRAVIEALSDLSRLLHLEFSPGNQNPRSDYFQIYKWV